MHALDPNQRSTRSRLRTAALFALATLVYPGNPALADERSGAARLEPFKRELQRALKAGLEKGPVDAIDACRLNAPRIAEAEGRDGVRVGRTSHRLRNPGNAGPAWVEPALAAYLADADDREPRSVELPGGRTGYVEPILMQTLCLTCHGSALTTEVSEHLADRYPADRATGFTAGELRGVFWIELSAESQ